MSFFFLNVGDELLSDTFPYKEIVNVILWEVEGKVSCLLSYTPVNEALLAIFVYDVALSSTLPSSCFMKLVIHVFRISLYVLLCTTKKINVPRTISQQVDVNK